MQLVKFVKMLITFRARTHTMISDFASSRVIQQGNKEIIQNVNTFSIASKRISKDIKNS